MVLISGNPRPVDNKLPPHLPNVDDHDAKRSRSRPGGTLVPFQRSVELVGSGLQNTTLNEHASMFKGASDLNVNGGQFTAADTVQYYAVQPGVQCNINISSSPDQARSPRSTDPAPDKASPRSEENDAQGDRKYQDRKRTFRQSNRPGANNKEGWDIYFQHIGVSRRGSPLWIPEPNRKLPVSYQRRGISIGDVGLLTESGSFDFLFNIRPEGRPTNPERLPQNFAVLDIPEEDIQQYSEFGHLNYISSTTIHKSQVRQDHLGLTFESDASEGAVLIMPVGSKSEDVRNIRHVRQFVAEHAKDWYSYVMDIRGREVRNGDLRIVVGHDKTTAWGIATFSDAASLKFQSTGENASGRSFRWEHSGTTTVRTGPDPQWAEKLRKGDEQNTAEYENQTLFVRTLNVTLREDIWKSISTHPVKGDKAGGESNTNPGPMPSRPTPRVSTNRHDSQSPYESGTSTKPNSLNVHPSNAINEKLLRDNPHARVAITTDQDWTSMLRNEDTVLPTPIELVDRLPKSACENGITFLEDKRSSYDSTNSTPIQKLRLPLNDRMIVPVAGNTNLKDLVILVMGPTGAGKSTFVNHGLPAQDLQQRMTIHTGLTSSVQEVKAAHISALSDHPRVRGRRLLLLDTPGFDDTYQPDQKILEDIAKALKEIYLKKNVLAGVIYLHDITQDRLSPAAIRSLEILERLCGEGAIKNIVLGTTKWGRKSVQNRQQHEQHEEELRNNYWKPLITRGALMLRFEDSEESVLHFLDTVLRRTADHGIILDIQRQLVDQQKTLADTPAGKRSVRDGIGNEKSKGGLIRRIRRFFGVK